MLPIHDVLADLHAALAASACAVLVAPPGAGKTTAVPPALMSAPWRGDGRIVMLEPRRLAARAAAARMAAAMGEAVGRTVGLRVRLETKVSAATRIEVVTEGVFTRMILDDPGLSDVAAVIFDEFHERSLDADLGLALARDAQRLLRPDLRLLVMSATLDGARVSALLDDAPVIESRGRMFPIETRHLSGSSAERIEARTAQAVRTALAQETGGVLVFLPGQGEILRCARLLEETLRDPRVDVVPLYGALGPAEQDRAVAPAPDGRRKVVLATAIAETSLTLEGVRVVIDAGLSRVPRYDPASGLTRLETVRVSQAAADQRRGRAGRTAPGVCYRLWEEAQTRALPPFARPEILDSDLSRLALDLARWGARDAEGLAFLDPPPAAAMSEARGLLARLGALDAAGALTAHGAALAGFALAPRLAHMVMRAAAVGAGARAALIAAVLTERGLGGTEVDLRRRLEALERDRTPRVRDARVLADRWAAQARAASPTQAADASPLEDGLLLAFAYPERIAKTRGKAGEFQLSSGRGVHMDPADPLAQSPWLAVGELGGGAAKDRILLAAPLDEASLVAAFGDRIVQEDRLEPSAGGRMRAVRVRRLDRLVLSRTELAGVDPALVTAALTDQVRREGLGVLPMGEACARLRARIGFAGGEGDDLSDAALIARLDAWLPPLLAGRTRLDDLSDGLIETALRALLPWDRLARLETTAPERWTAPTGTRLIIDYAAEGGPRIEVRVQELFGLSTHPVVGEGRVPLTLALLSPARRPIQVTRDLPGFWRGSWREVRSEMRGRYPRHPWPDDPAAAAPTTRVKPRGG